MAEPENVELVWRDLRSFPIEGKGWTDTENYYDRLPQKAKGVVRQPVWDLSLNSAGLCHFFQTDAVEIHARWTLRSDELCMPHFARTGVSGVDLYARTPQGAWQWMGVGKFKTYPPALFRLAAGLDGRMRSYRLYLPLYNGVEKVEIGVPPGASFGPTLLPSGRKPIVFYGTSVVQGGCASRPGMAYVAILGRRLDWPIINLGFSGNGFTEPELADLLTELDPAVYVIDSLPNLSPPAMVAERIEPFIRTLRKARPAVPIVMVESLVPCNSSFKVEKHEYLEKNRILREIYTRLRDGGDRNLHYITGEKLYGDDFESTVDGVHPTDLGFFRMADAIEPVLRPLIAR